MELQTIEIPRAQARETAAEYRRAAKTISDPDRRREFEEIARAYRIAARDEVPMIALTPTIAAGGTVTRTIVSGKGTDWERRTHYLLPKLAACRASAAFCYCTGVRDDGSVGFIDSLGRRDTYARGLLHLQTGLGRPAGYQHESLRPWRGSWSAMVPIVPPKHRPAGASSLDAYLVLWEVDAWVWRTNPKPPVDPALLRHVGGDIYAVLATWDLTPLEQLVLAGRTAEA